MRDGNFSRNTKTNKLFFFSTVLKLINKSHKDYIVIFHIHPHDLESLMYRFYYVQLLFNTTFYTLKISITHFSNVNSWPSATNCNITYFSPAAKKKNTGCTKPRGKKHTQRNRGDIYLQSARIETPVGTYRKQRSEINHATFPKFIIGVRPRARKKHTADLIYRRPQRSDIFFPLSLSLRLLRFGKSGSLFLSERVHTYT